MKSKYVDVQMSVFGNFNMLTLDQNNFTTQILNSDKSAVDIYNNHFRYSDKETIKFENQIEMYSLARDLGVSGNIFSLTGKAVLKDFELFEKIVQSKSTVVIAEHNTILYEDIIKIIREYPEINKKVIAINCDYFIAFRIIQEYYKSIKFSYIDLDLCQTAHLMIKQKKLIEKIHIMVTSDQVADRFCISLTYSRRGKMSKEERDYAENRIYNELNYVMSKRYHGIELVDNYLNPYIKSYGSPNNSNLKLKGCFMMTMAYIYDKSKWTRR